MNGSAKHDLREEMRALLRAVALPRRAGESNKAAIARAARALKIDPGRVKRYWYGEVAHPLAAEVDRARSFAAARPNPSPRPGWSAYWIRPWQRRQRDRQGSGS